MFSMDDNEGIQLKNDHLTQNVQDIMSNDEYSYNVIPLEEFCEQSIDPQDGNNFQLLNMNDVYQNFEIDIEELRTDIQNMSNSASQLTNLEDGSKMLQNLNTHDAPNTLNSGESMNHLQLNNCVSISQVDMMQSEKPTDINIMQCRSTISNQQQTCMETTQNSSSSSSQTSFLSDTYKIESISNVNEPCLVSLSFSNLAKIQMEKSFEPMVLVPSSMLRKLFGRGRNHLNMNPETRLSMNDEQQALPSKVAYDISERSTEDEKKQDEKYQADRKGCKKIDLCKVCGDKTGAHHYYGGRSCLGCRAFFRRSVKKFNEFPGFKYYCNCLEMCGKNGQLRCKLDKTTRNGCKYCRYKRCRDNAGMVDKWVLSAYTTTVKNKSNCDNTKITREERSKNKLAGKKTVPSTERESEMEIDPQFSAEFLEKMNTKYRKSFLRNSALIDTMKIYMKAKKQKVSSEQISKLEFFLGQDMQHIANEFEEFKKLTFDSQVILLKNNTATFSRMNFLKFMFESVLEEKFDQDKLVSLYRILFNDSKKKPKSNSKDAWLQIRIDSAIRLMVKLVDKDRDIFQFLMPIILFSNSSVGKQSIDEDVIHGSQLHFIQQLHQYLLIKEAGDKKVAAIRLGIANDLISRFREF